MSKVFHRRLYPGYSGTHRLPPAAALIQQLLDAGLLEHTGRHDALINCLAGSRLRSWHVVAGNQPGAAQRLKIYADLPH